MINRDIERLIELYLKGWITYEELIAYKERLEKSEKKDFPEPPTIY